MPQFCSEITESIFEPLPGTASHGKNFVLITWPKKFWNPKALQSDGLPADLDGWHQSQENAGNKIIVRLISRLDTSADSVDIFIFPERVRYSKIPPAKITELLERYFNGDGSPPYEKTASERKMIALCTHGTHDQCCAKLSSPLKKLFEDEIVRSKHEIDLWESSHLGGHRFASTCMVFPEGHQYGRVNQFPASEFLVCIASGRVYAPALRGDFRKKSIDQTAEVAGFIFCFDNEIKGKVYLVDKWSNRANAAQFLVAVDDESAGERINLLVRVELKEYIGPTSCKNLNEKNRRLNWVITDMSVLNRKQLANE